MSERITLSRNMSSCSAVQVPVVRGAVLGAFATSRHVQITSWCDEVEFGQMCGEFWWTGCDDLGWFIVEAVFAVGVTFKVVDEID